MHRLSNTFFMVLSVLIMWGVVYLATSGQPRPVMQRDWSTDSCVRVMLSDRTCADPPTIYDVVWVAPEWMR